MAKDAMLIVGGTGFVGSTLAREFSGTYQVTCTYQNEYTPIPGVNYVRTHNIHHKDAAKLLIQKTMPEIVIYCAGNNNLLYYEQDKNFQEAQEVHSGIVSHFIPIIDTMKGRFVYISSDYLFSGINGNFSVGDTAIPPSQLGKAKLGAENFIRNRSLHHLIFRCSPLIGRGTLDHPSWIDKLRENVIQGKKIKLSAKEIHNPVHISFLVQAIRNALEAGAKNKTFHIGGLARVSYYEFGTMLGELLKFDPALLEAQDAESQTHLDYTLNFTDTLSTLNLKPLALEESLRMLI